VFMKLTGYSRTKIMGHHTLEYVHPEDRELVRKKARESLKGKNGNSFEYRFVKKNGEILWLLERVASIVDKGERGTLGTIMDITAHKQLEDAVLQSDERYRAIIENIQDGYYENDLAGNLTFVNESICRMFGYTREELIGMNYKEYIAPEDTKRINQVYSKLYKTGKTVKTFEEVVIRKDGSRAFAEASASIMRDPQGKPVGFRGISRDVTESRWLEEAIRQSEERYRTIIEEMGNGYFEVDLDGNFTFFNNVMCAIHGYTPKELLGMNHRQFADDKNAKKIFEVFNKIYRTGETGKIFDYELIRKDGGKRQVEVTASLMRDPSGNPVGFRGITRDITERKKMEEALRLSEERYRTIIETMQDGYWETNLPGDFTFVNDAECTIAGTPKEQLIGRNNRQYTDKTTAKRLYETFKKIYTTGEPVTSCEFEFIRRNGTRRFSEFSASLIRDAQGEPIGFRGITRDTTERKRMEDELRRSEERYRTIIEKIQDGYFETDLTGAFTFVNDAICRRLGYTREEMIGMSNKALSDKEYAKRAFEFFNKIYTTGESGGLFEHELIRKDGSKSQVEISASLMMDSSGKVIGFRGTTRDVTERKMMEEALRQSEERYRTIIEKMEESYYELDLAGNFTFVNDAQCRNLGYSREELIGMNNRQYQTEEEVKRSFDIFRRIYETGEPVKGYSFEITRKNGTKAFHEVSVSLITDSKGKPIGFRGISRDITERMRMEEALRQSEERYRTIIEQMEDGYFEVDLTGNFTFVNDAECGNLGYSRDELIGMNNRRFADKENAKKVFAAFHSVYETGNPVKLFDYEVRRKDGTMVTNELSAALIRDADGKPVGFRGISRDVTERKRSEERIQHLATHDALTDLPNRRMFGQMLSHAIQTAQRYKKRFAVLFIDLDRFKNINDTLGHEAGDRLLQEIAGRLKQTLRASDTIARLGGDEFVILIEEVGDLKQVSIVAHRILSATLQPVVLMGEECRVTTSIGISVFPNDGEDEKTLMKKADMAMYVAKEEGKNNFQFFSKDIRPQSAERLAIEANLRLALERNELSLHYQAKLDFKTNRITGVEALLRWQNPALGPVSPVHFIPVAEETGLIVPIGRWVMKTACAQNTAWQRQGLPPICMAVNLSLRQLADENLIDDIKAALDEAGLAPGLLELEITESMVMHNPDRMIPVLGSIKKMGVRLAIDDFGTGYSSLGQIKHFPIDTLKVDRSFIRNIPRDTEDKAITEAILAMGKTLSLTIVAEGVETQEQMDFLRERSCDEMQGYYFSKPVTPERFAELLRTHVPFPKHEPGP
jgi:diguanylate cyclase (GGDEF)-like protein/PAS domain S-box-containing protein